MLESAYLSFQVLRDREAGSIITGVGDRLRERVAHYVYLDAVVPPDEATSWRWADAMSAKSRMERTAAIAAHHGLSLSELYRQKNEAITNYCMAALAIRAAMSRKRE